MSDRPISTLFMLMSVDGKISTGSADDRDFDQDLPHIPGVMAGLGQYYDLERETDLCSLNTGRVMAKVGWNDNKHNIERLPVDFVVVDSKPHLTERGVRNLLDRANKLYIVTTNTAHPAVGLGAPNLEVITYEHRIDLVDLFATLKAKRIERVTIQSGSELNAALARGGLVDFVSLVIAPLLVGGTGTAALLGGKSLEHEDDLRSIKAMRLLSATTLSDSYLHLRYEVINELPRP